MSTTDHAPRIRLLRRTVFISSTAGVVLLAAAWLLYAYGTFYQPGQRSVVGSLFLIALTLGAIAINVALISGMFLAARLSFARQPLGRVRQCPKCWYELEGIDSTRCPECGDELPARD